MALDADERRKRDRERKALARRLNPEHERELRRAYYKRHAAEIAENNLVKRATKREHAVARAKVQRAIAAGLLVRGPCEIGDDECLGQIDAHHDDYSRPLDVRWLCHGHHMKMHAS